MYEKLIKFLIKHKELSFFSVVVVVSLFLSSGQNKSDSQNPELQSEEFVFDTLIPEGQSLVPIEVANYETLDSLLGKYGVVDLFSVDPMNPEKGQKIASRVKILRAPKNPSHFAVLVPHLEAQHLLKFKGPLMVSIQNPKTNLGTSFEKSVQKVGSRITYE